MADVWGLADPRSTEVRTVSVTVAGKNSWGDDVADDGRPTWSRALLIDTAVELLRERGPDAITVEALTTSAQMSRATLYRQFPGCSEVLAAAFCELIPAAVSPPSAGPWRDRLVTVLTGHARAVAESPLIATAICWLALGRGQAGLAGAFGPEAADTPERSALRTRIGDWCSAPIDDVLASSAACAELGAIDAELVFALLIAPVVFGRPTRPHAVATAAVAAFAQAHSGRVGEDESGGT
jgi:AcrR family transcriptional regulator